MFSKKMMMSALIGASLVLSACGGGKSKVKIDATDGITLDGTFQEAIEGFEKADKLKAAAGLLILAYEGQDEDKRPTGYVREATEEASFLVDSQGGNSLFETRGSVMNDIARESKGVLDGKTAQDLIDHYNLATAQYDEFLKDQEEAKAEEDSREAAEAEVKRVEKIASMKTKLNSMQADLPSAGKANTAQRAQLLVVYDRAKEERDKLLAKQANMTGDVSPARGLNALSSNMSGQVIVAVINTQDKPIKSPLVQVDVKAADGKLYKGKPRGLYKAEERALLIAPGETKSMTFPVNIRYERGSAMSQTGRDFSDVDFNAYVVSYEFDDNSKVSLNLNPETQATLNNYAGAVEKCDAADAAIAKAGKMIPTTLKLLEAPDANADKLPALSPTRC